ASGASVPFVATAADAVDPAPGVLCDPVSGAHFPMGTSTVNCTATDAAGNQSTGSFDVTVGDASGPTLNLPGTLVREATGPSGAAVAYAVSASDAVDPAPVVHCSPSSGSTFVLGSTAVECTATDATGNESTGWFDVVVRDTTAPSMTGVPANITTSSATASGKAVTFGTPTATDAVSGPRPVDCSPASGSTFDVGTTSVRCSASDSAGNTTERTFSVTVTFEPPPTADYDVEWGEPISGGTLATNPSRTVPLKFRLWVDGVEITSGNAALSIARCGDETIVLTVDLAFSGSRWMGHLDMSDLGPGCFTATALIEGQAAGSFTIDVAGQDSKKGAPPKK
ncbi:MAG TPA: HYR domain-containing protein, partial [Candidatus Limnocylindrales bacterium]|nr:HYR domain-containing protein [Candidatus Limnocylindrales bacterium]